jgi:hypothetical protein
VEPLEILESKEFGVLLEMHCIIVEFQDLADRTVAEHA